MEPPSATPPPGSEEPDRDQPSEAGREEPPGAWHPPDSGRPLFAPPEPQASWPAEHTYPVRPSAPPPAPSGPVPTPHAPGYLLPGQVAPGAGPAGPFQGYDVPGHAPQGPGYEVPGHPVPGPPQGYPPQGYPPPGYAAPGYPPYGYPAKRGPGVVAAPPGTPFHQQDRTERHRWWRPVLGTFSLTGAALVAMVVVFIAWLVGHTVVTGEPPQVAEKENQLVGGPLEDLALQLALLGALIPLVPLTVWIFSRRPMGTVISVLGRMRWRWLGACLLAALVYIAVSLVTGMIVTAVFTDDPLLGDWVGWRAFLGPALVILLLVPFQSSAEELVFRGWVLQAIGGCTLRRPDGTYRNAFTQVMGRAFGTPWPAIAISSALFVAGHGYRSWAMVDIFVWAVVCGWLAVKTGGLEAPIALHVLNNLLAFGVTAAEGKLEDSLQQGAAPWYYLLSDLPPLFVFAALVLWLSRRMNIATVTPG